MFRLVIYTAGLVIYSWMLVTISFNSGVRQAVQALDNLDIEYLNQQTSGE